MLMMSKCILQKYVWFTMQLISKKIQILYHIFYTYIMKTKNEYAGHKIRGTKITLKTFSILVRTIVNHWKRCHCRIRRVQNRKILRGSRSDFALCRPRAHPGQPSRCKTPHIIQWPKSPGTFNHATKDFGGFLFRRKQSLSCQLALWDVWAFP